MVFQNPDETLNPATPWERRSRAPYACLALRAAASAIRHRVRELLSMTRLPATMPAADRASCPAARSSASALPAHLPARRVWSCRDEPVSALDVSVQAAITELLLDIQRTQRTTLILISHDLGFVRYIADSAVVMYLGQVMEAGAAERVFEPPWHPYTEALLSAAPTIDQAKIGQRIVLTGELPSSRVATRRLSLSHALPAQTRHDL